MEFKLINPRNFRVSGRKDKEAADVASEETRAIIKFQSQFLERNTEKAVYIFSDLLYAVDGFWNSNCLR